MADTKIEWCDKVWNPVTGCSPISEGCQNCYAKRMANRLRGRCGYPDAEPFNVTFHPDRLEEPMRWRKSQKIFVCSMGDLFHEDVFANVIVRVFNAMCHPDCLHHTFLLLTKRPKLALEWWEWFEKESLSDGNFRVLSEQGKFPPHIWFGVTTENQVMADERIPILLSIPAAKHFVSVEPMLGPLFGVDGKIAQRMKRDSTLYPADAIDLVIAGPETGPSARPCKPEWLEDLWRQCKAAGVPFFDKRKNYIEREWPE